MLFGQNFLVRERHVIPTVLVVTPKLHETVTTNSQLLDVDQRQWAHFMEASEHLQMQSLTKIP